MGRCGSGPSHPVRSYFRAVWIWSLGFRVVEGQGSPKIPDSKPQVPGFRVFRGLGVEGFGVQGTRFRALRLSLKLPTPSSWRS